jgi:O-methyltransferase/methyltransferase family protein
MTATLTQVRQGPGPSTPQPDVVRELFQCTTGYVVSSALWVAAELGIADLLSDGPRPVQQLAAQAKVDEGALYRTLRLLAMVGIFAETEPRHFKLTPTAELFRSDVPNSLRDAVVFLADPMHLQIASHLLHSVKTGQPTVEHVTGKPAFEYFAGEPVEFERFHRAMTAFSAIAIQAVLEVYDFSPFSTVVDVAGGHGYIICEILRRHPHLKGILFDLPDVVTGGEHRICQLQLDGRCRTVAGDFFKSVPQGGDLYLMKNIIHDWDEDRALTILGNCRAGLQGKPKGKLALIEFVVPDGNVPHMSKIIDLEMLYFPGGRERTEQEYGELFAKAGFRLTRVVATKAPYSVIEAELA